MDIVIDTSVIISVIANEPEKHALIDLTKGADLISPHSVHWEVGNAFSAMLKQRRITLDIVLKAIDLYKKIPIRFVDIELEKSLQLADQHNIYAYDSYLLRCALKYKSALISLDRNLLKKAKELHIKTLEVIS